MVLLTAITTVLSQKSAHKLHIIDTEPGLGDRGLV